MLTGCSKENAKEEKLVWTAINVNAQVQQGDAHLISVGKMHMLIDTGHFRYAKHILIPFLKKQDIKHLDSVLITHPHSDHYGGVTALLESNITISTLYMNFPTKGQMLQEPWGGKYEELLEIQKVCMAHHVKIKPIRMKESYKLAENSSIEVLYVYNGIDTPVGKTDLNDMSVVCMLHHGRNKFLFTGDINKRVGRYIAQHADDLKADILKFPHHGTQTYPPDLFFQKVNPHIIIVPSPKGLWWSQRSKHTRDMARKYSYRTYVNGFSGHITVTSDGKSYTVTEERKIEGILSK